MATNLYFPLLDSINNPITGSYVTLRLYSTSGSIANFPVSTFSNTLGTASFSNVYPSIYKLTYTSGGANNPSTYVAYDDVEVYLNIPDLSGSTVNGFNYITSSLELPSLSGSAGNGNEAQLGVDISNMANLLKNNLEDWCQQNKGICFVADDDNEKMNIGWNNTVGPRILIVYVGETPHGDESTSDLEGWVKRTFDIIIQRGKTLTANRNQALTNIVGNARPFYSQVEKVRDVVRTIELPTPMCYPTAIYDGMRPGEQSSWLMDSYILSFTILVQIGRASVLPPQLSNNGVPFLNLNDISCPPNTTP